jgi:hypothetical protein
MRSLARSVLLPPGSACYRPVAACPKFASDQPRARHAIKGVTRQHGQPGCGGSGLAVGDVLRVSGRQRRPARDWQQRSALRRR